MSFTRIYYLLFILSISFCSCYKCKVCEFSYQYNYDHYGVMQPIAKNYKSEKVCNKKGKKEAENNMEAEAIQLKDSLSKNSNVYDLTVSEVYCYDYFNE